MFILINFKAYSIDPGEIATAAAAVDDAVTHEIAVAPQTADLSTVAETGVETWAQHTSPNEPGSYTGSTVAESLSRNGATGTLINHSEYRLTLANIDDAISSAKRVGLNTVVCANTPEQIAAVTALGPDAVAIEPPELIGTGTPVSQADPDIVREAVDAAHSIDSSVSVYCGAGISTAEDIEAAEALGAEGVLLASGVAKANNPIEALKQLVSD